MAEFDSDKTKAEAKKAMLEMAKYWYKQDKVQHAIENLEAVIEADPESEEAGQARDALIEIAERFEKEGKKYSAYHLYHKLATGRVGSHNRI